MVDYEYCLFIYLFINLISILKYYFHVEAEADRTDIDEDGWEGGNFWITQI